MPWLLAKACMVFFVLGYASSCSHARKPWHEECQIHRACKPIEPLPRCSPELVASAARRAFTASKDRNDVRSVEGTLQAGYIGCTKAACIDESGRQRICCNQCIRRLVLVGEDGSVVGLTGKECDGDESRLCCTIDVQGQKVIATGVLEGFEQGKVWFKGPYDVCVL